jgi:hypothetical protein
VSPEKIIGYVRDAGCVLVGLGGITYQIVTGQTSVQLLTVCMALLGITGAINVRQLRPPTRSTSGGRGRSSRASSSASRSRPSPRAEDEEAT